MQLKTSVPFITSLQTGHISCGMGLECETIALCVMLAVNVISMRLYPGQRWAVLAVYRPRRRFTAGSENSREAFRKFWNWCDISWRLTASAVGAFHTKIGQGHLNRLQTDSREDHSQKYRIHQHKRALDLLPFKVVTNDKDDENVETHFCSALQALSKVWQEGWAGLVILITSYKKITLPQSWWKTTSTLLVTPRWSDWFIWLRSPGSKLVTGFPLRLKTTKC